jgi:hypothetical protein
MFKLRRTELALLLAIGGARGPRGRLPDETGIVEVGVEFECAELDIRPARYRVIGVSEDDVALTRLEWIPEPWERRRG